MVRTLASASLATGQSMNTEIVEMPYIPGGQIGPVSEQDAGDECISNFSRTADRAPCELDAAAFAALSSFFRSRFFAGADRLIQDLADFGLHAVSAPPRALKRFLTASSSMRTTSWAIATT
jgi:hypothetical protein